METTIKTQQVKINLTTSSIKQESVWDQFESSRFGIIPILLVIVGCMGGIAAGFGAKGDAVQLAIIVFPTVITLAFMLAVSPMRFIIWSSIIALICQIAVLIF